MAKCYLPTGRPERAPGEERSTIWNGFRNFISNNGEFSALCLYVSLPAIRQGSLLSPYPIYPPSPRLKGKTGVNVLLQPAKDGFQLCAPAGPALFLTSLIAFSWILLAFHLQPSSMSAVCFLFSRGKSYEGV